MKSNTTLGRVASVGVAAAVTAGLAVAGTSTASADSNWTTFTNTVGLHLDTGSSGYAGNATQPRSSMRRSCSEPTPPLPNCRSGSGESDHRSAPAPCTGTTRPQVSAGRYVPTALCSPRKRVPGRSRHTSPSTATSASPPFVASPTGPPDSRSGCSDGVQRGRNNRIIGCGRVPHGSGVRRRPGPASTCAR